MAAVAGYSVTLPLGWELADDCRASVSSFVGGGGWARREAWALSSLEVPKDPSTSPRMPNEGAQLWDGYHSTLKLGQADSGATSAGLQK